VSNRSASSVVNTGRIDLGWNGIGGLWLSSWKIGLNCARREGNGAATEELRRSSVALICVEGIVAFATLAKSLSEDCGLRLELNRGVEIDAVRCRSFCLGSALSWTTLRKGRFVQDYRGYFGGDHPYAIQSREFDRFCLGF
jgi:hypothetical protein